MAMNHSILSDIVFSLAVGHKPQHTKYCRVQINKGPLITVCNLMQCLVGQRYTNYSVQSHTVSSWSEVHKSQDVTCEMAYIPFWMPDLMFIWTVGHIHVPLHSPVFSGTNLQFKISVDGILKLTLRNSRERKGMCKLNCCLSFEFTFFFVSFLRILMT